MNTGVKITNEPNFYQIQHIIHRSASVLLNDNGKRRRDEDVKTDRQLSEPVQNQEPIHRQLS